jgi:hypothetical protein
LGLKRQPPSDNVSISRPVKTGRRGRVRSELNAARPRGVKYA